MEGVDKKTKSEVAEEVKTRNEKNEK